MKKSLSILLLIMALPASAEIYKWTDAQGKVHYGDRPAEDAKELDVDIEKKGHIRTSDEREHKRRRLIDAYEEDNRKEAEARARQKKQQAKRQRECLKARDRLRRYKKAGYLYDLDKNGNRVAIPDEEKSRATRQLQKDIDRYCK